MRDMTNTKILEVHMCNPQNLYHPVEGDGANIYKAPR